MGLSRVRLGEVIEVVDERNTENTFREDAVVGLSTQKEIIETKADLVGVSLTSYKIFTTGDFAYVPDTCRRGDKMALTYNKTNKTYLISSIYIVFRVTRPDLLLSDYLFMYFNRAEFDRYARFNSWGSAREIFTFADLCDIELPLPSIAIQKKYVDIYNALKANKKVYSAGLEDIKRACEVYIEKLRGKYEAVEIGGYIEPYNEKNVNCKITLEQGININKEFITPQRSNSNLKGRKIVRHGQFAYCTQLNNKNVAIAYREGCDCVVSSVYDVFGIINKALIPEYLMLWLIRQEFGRYVY